MQANIQIAGVPELTPREFPQLTGINTNTPEVFFASIVNLGQVLQGLLERVAESLWYESDELSEQLYSLVSSPRNVTVSDAHMDLILEGLVEQVLGRKALDRFSELKKISHGWNFGKGEPMTERARRNLHALLLHLANPPPDPKLFLLSDGSLELMWKLSDEKQVSVISTSAGFEVFHSSLDEEMSFTDNDFQGVLKAIALESSARA
jgi:hypothetical protein